MTLDRLDHYFVYASDLEQSRKFYDEVLGLTQGPRPDFGFPGFWFYIGEQAVVHIGNEEFEGGYVEEDEPISTTGNTGAVDHIAFRGKDIENFENRFNELNLRYERREIPDFSLSQLFIKDPNGITIELNFFHV